MLVLTRKSHQGITIEHPSGLIHVVVNWISGDYVSIGVAAPREVAVNRDELLARKKEEGEEVTNG